MLASRQHATGPPPSPAGGEEGEAASQDRLSVMLPTFNEVGNIGILMEGIPGGTVLNPSGDYGEYFYRFDLPSQEPRAPSRGRVPARVSPAIVGSLKPS